MVGEGEKKSEKGFNNVDIVKCMYVNMGHVKTMYVNMGQHFEFLIFLEKNSGDSVANTCTEAHEFSLTMYHSFLPAVKCDILRVEIV